MPPRLPEFPKRSIRPRIDHEAFANEDVEKLRRRIRYPSSSKPYKGTERLEAVRECLHNRVRDEQSMVAFAYCVARDPRMSRPMRDFANEAIRKSKTYIQKKMKKLEALRKHWRKVFEKSRIRWLAEERNGKMNRTQVVHDLKAILRQYEQLYSNMEAWWLLEWDFYKHGPETFRSALAEEMHHFNVTLAITQGLHGSRLPNDIKRRVFREVVPTNLRKQFLAYNSNEEMSPPSLFSMNTNNNGSSGSNSNRSGRSSSRSNGHRRS